ncbi:protein Hook homolog 3-like isoform X2 [Xenopus laevis]|uniref:Protein Hook homolog 3-like isoform X2 n=1 Tax=Xenopus laevis TaxID=8355 RepID=A0A8J0UZC3_XENLA|nr:protein Hook homolog 3-like isoform X2 [Xenopus laevis]
MLNVESMDRVDLCESLLTWIQTFHVDAQCKTVGDLTSGVAMAMVLQKIDPVYFDENWLNRIKTDVGDNWRLKISNLKKILKGILDYNHEILGHQINDFTLPDVNLVGEHSDPSELGRMLQLILGCAVQCEQKQEYIQTIMMMEESVQHMVMTAIQELMSKETPVSIGTDAYAELDRQLKKANEELNDALAAKEEIAQRCHELDMQAYYIQEDRDKLRFECNELEERVAGLQEEKSSLLAENQILMERMNQSDSLEDPNSPAGRRHLQLQTQLEQLQEETFRLEASKDDYRIRCEELEKEITELRQQNEDLTTLADEAQSLKDEMDVLRHSSDKVAKLEGQVESYKKKLEDLGDLRRQVKLLEEKNTMYMQNTVSLEEELRKANAARSQLETYKRQVVELQNRLSEESKKADKLEFEYKRLKEKIDSLQKEKDRLRSERDSLKETIEELRCVQAQEGQLTSAGLMPLGNQEPTDSLAAEIVTPEIKEKLIRLQHENKMLKINQEGSDNEKISLLQSLLDDSNMRKNELETENRLVNQRLIEMQSQVEELQKSLQEQGAKAEDSLLLKKKLEEHLEKLHEANNELQKKRAIIEDLEPRYNNSSIKIEELQDALRKKEEDMKQMEERYKKYLEKAKSVIRTLDPKQNQGTGPEIQALKNQLQERDKMFLSLEKEFEKTKTQRDQEEKLIVSAWYNMAPDAETPKLFSYSDLDASRITAPFLGKGDFLSLELCKTIPQRLESIHKKKTELELHAITLTEYYKIKHIPRGLRSPLKPKLFSDDWEFCDKWEGICNKYSLDLIILCIEQIHKELIGLYVEVLKVEQVAAQIPHFDLSSFKADLEKRLKEFTRELEERKRSKFMRDHQDYIQKKVYGWRCPADSNSDTANTLYNTDRKGGEPFAYTSSAVSSAGYSGYPGHSSSAGVRWGLKGLRRPQATWWRPRGQPPRRSRW